MLSWNLSINIYFADKKTLRFNNWTNSWWIKSRSFHSKSTHAAFSEVFMLKLWALLWSLLLSWADSFGSQFNFAILEDEWNVYFFSQGKEYMGIKLVYKWIQPEWK